jgi:very-short-patch-repair endonuclease
MNFDTLTKEERHIAIKQSHTDTESEAIFKHLLEQNNIEYQQEVIIGKFRVDFIINGNVYEINGGYHNSKKQRKKDKTRASYLLKRGYEITEITNKQVFQCQNKEINLEKLLKKDNRCVDKKFIVKPTKKKNQKANEYRRKMWKIAYQKKKEWKKQIAN